MGDLDGWLGAWRCRGWSGAKVLPDLAVMAIQELGALPEGKHTLFLEGHEAAALEVTLLLLGGGEVDINAKTFGPDVLAVLEGGVLGVSGGEYRFDRARPASRSRARLPNAQAGHWHVSGYGLGGQLLETCPLRCRSGAHQVIPLGC